MRIVALLYANSRREELVAVGVLITIISMGAIVLLLRAIALISNILGSH
jgi:hypothetical protein